MKSKLFVFFFGMALLPLLVMIQPSFAQQNGSIRVTFNLPDRLQTGALWRILPNQAWIVPQSFPKPPGNYIVEFRDVVGWSKPAPINVTVTAGRETPIPGTYTKITGDLHVGIVPNEVNPPGAMLFKVDNGPWINGNWAFNLSPGHHIVEFLELAGWVRPFPINVTINIGQETRITGTYTRAVGSIWGGVQPNDAAGAGAQWRVDGGAWMGNGDTAFELTPGNHNVEFKEINRWTRPAAMVVNVEVGKRSSITGTYTRATGNVWVNIEPFAARNAGAQWRIDGGVWQLPADWVRNLNPGSRNVEFKEVAGWTRPAARNVTVAVGQDTRVTETYIQYGALRVNIQPQEAVAAGAQWQLQSSKALGWRSSGETAGNIRIGQHQVEFKDLTGWMKPGNQTVAVTAGQTAQMVGEYRRAFGNLTVTIQPQGAITAGGQWRIGNSPWQKSGATVSNLTVGTHLVEFQDVPGWIKPGQVPVTINTEQTSQSTGMYRK